MRRLELALSSGAHQARPPWYESNLLWFGTATFVAIILTLVAAMKQDFRWLLWPAWIVVGIPLWITIKNITKSSQGRLIIPIFILSIGLVGGGLYMFNRWLEPPPPVIVAPETPDQIKDKLIGWVEKAGLYEVEPLAPDSLEDFRFNIIAHDFSCTLSKIKNRDRISLQSDMIFILDSKIDPSIGEISAEDKRQLRQDIGLELTKMGTEYSVAINDRNDFRIKFMRTIFYNSLTEEKFLHDLFGYGGAKRLTLAMVQSKIAEMRKQNQEIIKKQK